MANIQSLSSLRKKEEEQNKDQELYAGGIGNSGGGSGLNVVDPVNDQSANVFDQLVNKARANTTERDPTRMETIKITLYKGGFTINDGVFRNENEPENVRFMEELTAGYIPKELLTQEKSLDGILKPPKQHIGIDIEDKRDSVYVAPAYVAFSGTGNSLASSSSTDSSTVVTLSLIEQWKQTHSNLVVDNSKPTTTLQLRSMNGKRLRIQANTTNTVSQLIVLIESQLNSTSPYILSAGYPPSDLKLSQFEETLEKLSLLNTSIIQKKG